LGEFFRYSNVAGTAMQEFKLEFNIWMDEFETFATEPFKKWFLIEINIPLSFLNLCMEK